MAADTLPRLEHYLDLVDKDRKAADEYVASTGDARLQSFVVIRHSMLEGFDRFMAKHSASNSNI
jgi:hypothetical protein